jgi:hypothetical protein
MIGVNKSRLVSLVHVDSRREGRFRVDLRAECNRYYTLVEEEAWVRVWRGCQWISGRRGFLPNICARGPP